MSDVVIYHRWRSDGWPYCPRCDEDELYSGDVKPTVLTIVGCYACGWRAPWTEDLPQA